MTVSTGVQKTRHGESRTRLFIGVASLKSSRILASPQQVTGAAEGHNPRPSQGAQTKRSARKLLPGSRTLPRPQTSAFFCGCEPILPTATKRRFLFADRTERSMARTIRQLCGFLTQAG